MSSPRRSTRPKLPFRFARPKLEQLEGRLPPGDLSFVWLLGDVESPPDKALDPPEQLPGPRYQDQQPAAQTDRDVTLPPTTAQPAASAPVSQSPAAPTTDPSANLAVLAGLFPATDARQSRTTTPEANATRPPVTSGSSTTAEVKPGPSGTPPAVVNVGGTDVKTGGGVVNVGATSVGSKVTVTRDGASSDVSPFPGFTGTVSTGLGDVNKDGTRDVLVGASVSGHVKVLDGKSGAEIRSFFPFANYTGGTYVAGGDISGDGVDDVIVGATINGHVKVFDGVTGAEIRSFTANANFAGEVRVGSGDVNGDGRDDVITGAGSGAFGHVKVFSGVDNSELRSFLAYTNFEGGVFVAGGDVNGDGRDDVVTGAEANGHVKVFSGIDNSEVRSFFAFPGFLGKARVEARDVNGDGFSDLIVETADGKNLSRKFDGRTLEPLSEVTKPNEISTGSFEIVSVSEDTGSSDSDGVTSDNTPTVAGTGTPGLTLQVLADGAVKGSVVVNAQGQWSFTLPRLSEGDHTLEVGIQGQPDLTQSRTLSIDTTAPRPTLSGSEYAVTLSPTLTVSTGGSDGDYSVIDVDWNGDGDFIDDGEAGAYQAAVSQEGTVTLDGMKGGNWDLRLRTTDQAGNVGTSRTFRLHVAMDLDRIPTLVDGVYQITEEGSHGAGCNCGCPTCAAALAAQTNPDVSPFGFGADGAGGALPGDGGADGAGGANDAGGGGGNLPAPVVPFTETEPNNTQGTGNMITLPTNDFLAISGNVTTGTDQDWFVFTLAARTGVFFDVDSRETGLSTTLNSVLTLVNSAGTTIETNDDGYDFDTGFPAPVLASATSADSAIYRDLAAGTYAIRVSSASNTTGAYVLNVRGDTDYSNTVPALNSRPTATDTIFLDFNGHASTNDAWTAANSNTPYNIAPFDFNANAAELTPGEKLMIRNIWRILSEDFSPFNINISTTYTGPFAGGVANHAVFGGTANQVGPAGPIGLAFVDSYSSASTTNKEFFTFAADPFFRPTPATASSDQVMLRSLLLANTAAHEAGHTMGLLHYGGANTQPLAIMEFQIGFGNQALWRTALTSDRSADVPPAPFVQDDMMLISRPLNTFGYAPDDHGNTQGAASVLTATGARYSASGVIAQAATDVDFFRFRATTGGPTVINVNVDEYLNDLDLQITLLDAGGATVATASPTTFDATISMPLADANYFLRVSGTGQPGIAGQYAVTIDVPAPPPPPGPPMPGPLPPSVFSGDQFEPNDTSDAATNFGPQSNLTLNGLTIANTPEGLPDYDWFRFVVGNTSTYNFTLQPGLGGPLTMFVYTFDGGVLTPVSDGGATAQLPLVAGMEIYVEVMGVSTGVGFMNEGTYSLRIQG